MGVPVPRRSVLKASTKNLASTARDVGNFGGQLAELTTEVKRTRASPGAAGADHIADSKTVAARYLSCRRTVCRMPPLRK
jgi:hypothetical protein